MDKLLLETAFGDTMTDHPESMQPQKLSSPLLNTNLAPALADIISNSPCVDQEKVEKRTINFVSLAPQ